MVDFQDSGNLCVDFILFYFIVLSLFKLIGLMLLLINFQFCFGGLTEFWPQLHTYFLLLHFLSLLSVSNWAEIQVSQCSLMFLHHVKFPEYIHIFV